LALSPSGDGPKPATFIRRPAAGSKSASRSLPAIPVGDVLGLHPHELAQEFLRLVYRVTVSRQLVDEFTLASDYRLALADVALCLFQ
ncbi:hypothetical protein, partial [Mesorhizobium sp.]|uniref:hypothetical protein n=1 Tax=Mesorhizobium sp. TaxID=1871066 RepID=UPI0025C50BC6